MFVGHALLAFALVAGVAVHVGVSRERALGLGLVAGAFATAPDVDIAYALVGVAGAGVAPPLALATAFWSTGSLVHRAITHSLVVAPVAAVAVAAVAAGVRGRRIGWIGGVGLLAVLTAVAGAASGPLGAAVMALFGLTLAAVAVVAVRLVALGPRATLATAFAGLVSHPFGDLFTGHAPTLLYPFETALLTGRVTLHADPTLHLLGAFGVELATVWVALGVLTHLLGVRLLPHLAPRAGIGAGYAVVLPALPAPTLDLSYPFVFSVLAVGALGLVPHVRRGLGGLRSGRLPLERPSPGLDGAADVTAASDRLTGALGTAGTALAAVTLAWGAYAAAYLVFG